MKKLINLITADTAQKRETLSERSDYVDVIKFKNALNLFISSLKFSLNWYFKNSYNFSGLD